MIPQVKVPDWAVPLYKPHRYKILYGGRSSGKTWQIARALVLQGYQSPLRIICVREHKTALRKSAKPAIEDAIRAMKQLAGSEGVEIEMREVYSTPFVFLTDTFTGKSLCFCDLGRGHPFRNEVSQLPSFFTSIGPSKICPHMGIDFVLYHPSS